MKDLKNCDKCNDEHDQSCDCGEDCDNEPTAITLNMKDGTKRDFTLMGILELAGNQYIAISEQDSDEYDILRFEESGGEHDSISISIIEDEAEYSAVADKFDEILNRAPTKE